MIDPVSQELKRLIEFNGMKITNVRTTGSGLEMSLTRDDKDFKLVINKGCITLYDDEGKEIDAVIPAPEVGIAGVHGYGTASAYMGTFSQMPINSNNVPWSL